MKNPSNCLHQCRRAVVTKVLSIAISLAMCLSLTACWDSTEVKDLALVLATGIDKADNGRVRITVQIAIPSTIAGGQAATKGPSDKAFLVESAVGLDKRQAIQKIQEQLSREFYPSHQQVVVIGEAKAKAGVQNILDTLSRDPLNRWRTIVLVARDGTANEMLKTKTILEPLSSKQAKKLDMTSVGSETTVLKFLNNMSAEGIVPTAGAIVKSTAGDEPIRISSAAVFRHGKLIGYLNDEEARGLLWIKGKMRRAYVTASGFPNHGAVTMYVTSTQSRIRHHLSGGVLHFDITLAGKGEIIENTANMNFHNPRDVQLVQRKLDDSLLAYTTQLVSCSQTELHADVIGLGQEIYRDDPRLWKQFGAHWTASYPDVKIHMHVHLHPLRPGTTGSAFQAVE